MILDHAILKENIINTIKIDSLLYTIDFMLVNMKKNILKKNKIGSNVYCCANIMTIVTEVSMVPLD